MRRTITRLGLGAALVASSVGAIVAWHRVDKGQRLDGEAKSRELLLERFQTMKLISQRRGPLELQPLARARHLGA